MPAVIVPFGLSPLGLPPAPLPGQLARPTVVAAEWFDPKTRDVKTFLRGNDVIDDQVQVAMTAVRGSGAALGTSGQNFRAILKLGTNVERQLETEARTTLATLVDRGDISIDAIGVVVDSPNTWAEVTIDYINLRAVGQQKRQHVVRVEASTQ